MQGYSCFVLVHYKHKFLTLLHLNGEGWNYFLTHACISIAKRTSILIFLIYSIISWSSCMVLLQILNLVAWHDSLAYALICCSTHMSRHVNLLIAILVNLFFFFKQEKELNVVVWTFFFFKLFKCKQRKLKNYWGDKLNIKFFNIKLKEKMRFSTSA